MHLTEGELEFIERTGAIITRLKNHLNSKPCPETSTSLIEWLDYLASMKEIVGNADNKMTFVAALLARKYLSEKLPMRSYDVAAKSMSAPGLDIDEKTLENQRVIAEIKTTMPCRVKDLGAQQKDSFRQDFIKLNKTPADHKFFFVTTDTTFALMKQKYASEIPGVLIVLLTTGEEYCVET